jgi:predicted glycogen debranching enzyme
MSLNAELNQQPATGARLVKFRGDTLTFTLNLSKPLRGTAWLRTNLGKANIARMEIIREVENDETLLERAWFDIPMAPADDHNFTATLPLNEVGHFEAKCFFLEKGDVKPRWPQGANVSVNVEPADTCCANIIYNCFVRQFGPNKKGDAPPSTSQAETIADLDKAGYAVIPPSGKFRDLIKELDFIIGHLGCRILMLLPIHPTPTTYGRMGRFGSPYAALSFTAVDPALAVFDPHATPLEQFIELVDAAHQRNAKIFIDIAINHTGWAAGLHESHPKWLARGPHGRIEVPGAWGVRWEDLTKLDYTHKDLWQYMADVFITWCRRGVDGFRCDAGYMIPQAAWKYIIAKIRQQYPDTVFLLEGLGGKISVTRALLNSANLNWAYSELFQNYDRQQIENYLPEAIDISNTDGLTVHFAETHDNPRLAAQTVEYARMRTALSALFSAQGAFGFANGVEWFATEKINVHDSPSLNWGAQPNQVDHIRRLNHLLKTHPAFHADVGLKMVQQNDGNFLVLLRHHRPTEKNLLIVINLDDRTPAIAFWDPQKTGISQQLLYDLIGGTEVKLSISENLQRISLAPGQAMCLSPDKKDLDLLPAPAQQAFSLPPRTETQRLRAKVLDIVTHYRDYGDLADFDIDLAVRQLKKDPQAFCASLNTGSKEPRVITWQWPRDIRRQVMLPPGHFLLIKSADPFCVQIVEKGENGKTLAGDNSICDVHGSHFTLLAPFSSAESIQDYSLKTSVYTSQGCQHHEACLLGLPQAEKITTKRFFRRTELRNSNFLFLATNGRGAMLRAPVSWGKLASRYDGLLAANINPDYPENRWIMFSRCRAWLVYQDYSQEINTSCLETFSNDDSSKGCWQYHIPTGRGENVLISIRLEMLNNENAVRLSFYRDLARPRQNMLQDSKAIRLILRPDIENRSFHETTKAYRGPEDRWPNSVTTKSNGFTFCPDENHFLDMNISSGKFVWEPEWHYMVHRGMDAERGMDPDSDLFSPGYFYGELAGGQAIALTAAVSSDENSAGVHFIPDDENLRFETSEKSQECKPVDVLRRAMDAYVVNRGQLKTVIAGYPWFLDWGRDALIFVRGLIGSQKTRWARAILQQFGQFEKGGTLPNMIAGNNATNRDTSDAPLWFFTACADLIQAEQNSSFLESDCGGRPVHDVLLSIGRSTISGTSSGVAMDPDSGLVYSPAHFSWMDTNHPAGTPRQGYPIEIQALWHAALCFLSRIDAGGGHKKWDELAKRVESSVRDLFWDNELGYLCDCLHATSGQTAHQASADDALRPNQLLAITLGAVSDSHLTQRILAACEELLVPGAIRSLADRPLQRPLEIFHNGKLMIDPYQPYHGKYEGDEDTQRKPSYHNGTAWTWLFPSYCEAWAMAYGTQGKQTALAWLSSSIRLLEQGCVGHIPEILDGDSPHAPKGCDAQAWGASELLRVWLKLGD